MSVQTHYPSRSNSMTACGVGDSPVPLLGNLISDCHDIVSQEPLTLPVGRSPPSWYERNHTDWCECAEMSSRGHCTRRGKHLRRTHWSYARRCATLVWLHRADWNGHINLTQLLVIIGDVATRATIGMGTSHNTTPSLPWWTGNWPQNWLANEFTPPVK